MGHNISMTREELVQKLQALSADQYSRIAPFLEADIESVDDLAALHQEIESGRQSADQEPILESKDVYARARKALSG